MMFNWISYEEKMATNKINDSVGKRIVEALKMQVPETSESEMNEDYNIQEDNDVLFEKKEQTAEPVQEIITPIQKEVSMPQNIQLKVQSQLQEQAKQAQFNTNSLDNQSFIDNAFAQSLAQNIGYSQVQSDFNYPANVAVLKQLIAKLPTGVSKQTGAIIIKQTMEALGISIQSVIQEAKQVQDTLNENAKECQSNIIEYRKQIGILEAKSQQYARQSAEMNDIISLFIHTGR